ncbi:MAG: carbohydrate porin [Betaproteobacteria bacterium]|nr:MAG: carbohydrate porin [Betaproteobacteria bacterium]
MKPRHAIALAAATLLAGSAHALDWNGYFRAGPGATTTKGASRACYGLPAEGLKYRLGNECDIYGEFQLSQDFKADGIDYKAVLMTDFWNGASDLSGDDSTHNRLRIEQLYVEGKGFDFAPGATFWIGKERGRRGDVHIVDTFFTQMRGRQRHRGRARQAGGRVLRWRHRFRRHRRGEARERRVLRHRRQPRRQARLHRHADRQRRRRQGHGAVGAPHAGRPARRRQLAVAAVRARLGRPEQQLRQPRRRLAHQVLAHRRRLQLAAGPVRRPGLRAVGPAALARCHHRRNPQAD